MQNGPGWSKPHTNSIALLFSFVQRLKSTIASQAEEIRCLKMESKRKDSQIQESTRSIASLREQVSAAVHAQHACCMCNK